MSGFEFDPEKSGEPEKSFVEGRDIVTHPVYRSFCHQDRRQEAQVMGSRGDHCLCGVGEFSFLPF